MGEAAPETDEAPPDSNGRPPTWPAAPPPAAPRPRRRAWRFYGWRIVGAGAGLEALMGAFFFHSFGAYVVLLTAQFGWSKTALAGGFAIARAVEGAVGPGQGWLLDRLGPRTVMHIGVLLFGGGLVLFSRIDSIAGFYAAFFVISLGATMGGFLSILVPLVHWFERRRSLAIALAFMGFAVGGMLQPLVALALEGWGWRTTALASGLLSIAIGAPLVHVMRHRPQEMGEHPDGIDPAEATERALPSPDGGIDFTVGEALRTPAFWLISAGHGSALVLVAALLVHFVPYATEELGYSLQGAAQVVLLLTLLQAAGQLLGGVVGDRFSKRLIAAACMGGHALALLMLAAASALWMVLAFALIHGFAWGVRGPLMGSIRADYFGRRAFGVIMGISNIFAMVGMIVGPLVVGVVVDRTGSYEGAFLLLAVLGAAASSFFLLATPPRPPRRPAGDEAPPGGAEAADARAAAGG